MFSAASGHQLDEEIAVMPVAEEGGIPFKQRPQADTVFNPTIIARNQPPGIPVQSRNLPIPVHREKHRCAIGGFDRDDRFPAELFAEKTLSNCASRCFHKRAG
jgi:hypothetical protein